MHGATRDVLGIWARRKGGQTCDGAGRVSGWGLSRGASLRRVVGGPARPRHVEKGRGASVVVGARAWGHAGCVGDLGTSEGRPDVWWGRTRVWVGPVAWGVVEGRRVQTVVEGLGKAMACGYAWVWAGRRRGWVCVGGASVSTASVAGNSKPTSTGTARWSVPCTMHGPWEV